ncbi:hypothetical protein [Burkholderia gladioli]|uniref:hypothetical protein n=1 Tax=Burkholderia gladioli TaxID=28095 RepID=UPI00163E8556|nr:hypothetical protein [Burkholderia gladioli]
MLKGLCKTSVIGGATVLLVACTNTGAIKIGPDTYSVSTRVPLGGPASAKGEALQTANSYCQSQQRELLVDRMQSGECALHGGCGEAEVTFYCLKAGDSALARPHYGDSRTSGQM